MRSRLFDRRFLLFSALSGFMLAVAGCQSGDNPAAVAPSADGDAQTQEKITEAELRGFCPGVSLRDGTAFFNTYAKGGDGDATKIIYQASISDVTRTCRNEGGTMTMNVAVAGRIVPGPAFAAGTITMPIRIVATHGNEVLYSQIFRHQVNVSDGSAATQFVFNDPNVSFVIPEDKAVRVFAGYDEGPAKKAATAE
jgi:hypothetical protein